jgi:hypothetical protein
MNPTDRLICIFQADNSLLFSRPKTSEYHAIPLLNLSPLQVNEKVINSFKGVGDDTTVHFHNGELSEVTTLKELFKKLNIP